MLLFGVSEVLYLSWSKVRGSRSIGEGVCRAVVRNGLNGGFYIDDGFCIGGGFVLAVDLYCRDYVAVWGWVIEFRYYGDDDGEYQGHVSEFNLKGCAD